MRLPSAGSILAEASRGPDGSRKVTRFREVVGWRHAPETHVMHEIFYREVHGTDTRGDVMCAFVPTGHAPRGGARLREQGRDGLAAAGAGANDNPYPTGYG